MVYRHPFPGPRLEVRVVSEVRAKCLELLRRPMRSSLTNCTQYARRRRIGTRDLDRPSPVPDGEVGGRWAMGPLTNGALLT